MMTRIAVSLQLHGDARAVERGVFSGSASLLRSGSSFINSVAASCPFDVVSASLRDLRRGVEQSASATASKNPDSRQRAKTPDRVNGKPRWRRFSMP